MIDALSGLKAQIAAATGRIVIDATPLGGGIAPVYRVTLDDGSELAAKLGAGLALEARMLIELGRRAPAPDVVHVDDALLLMTYIESAGGLTSAAEVELAGIVARLHGVTGSHYGYAYDTVIGGLPQPNRESADWRGFFRDQRLYAMAQAAYAAGRMPATLLHRIEALAGRLERWIDDPATPALIHGDLWSGNILARDGRIVGLIDPALYFADPEIELAFLTLFSTVGETFFAAYRERRPIRAGFFEARRDLYNLYPLLVHVRLFGGSYIDDVARTLDRFGV